jgi:cysteine desulfurase
MHLVYLDNNATTRIAPAVLEEMQAYLTDLFFNASSPCEAALPAAHALTLARQRVALLLGVANPQQIIFTSGATESNNAALFGVTHANQLRRHIITSSAEHTSVLAYCHRLETEGYSITYLPVDPQGLIDPAILEKALRPDTALVSIILANNETGVILPIGDYSRLVKRFDPAILLHTVATQAAGKIPIDLDRELSEVDLVSLSSHKMHGPKGVGALFLREGTPWLPFIIGGQQERGQRGGTYNVGGIVGFGKACELWLEGKVQQILMQRLRDSLETFIKNQIPDVLINGAGAPRLPNTLNVSFRNIAGESLIQALGHVGICASTGAACSSGGDEPSHVLRSMRVPHDFIHGSIRFSFSRDNTMEECEYVCRELQTAVERLRELNP